MKTHYFKVQALLLFISNLSKAEWIFKESGLKFEVIKFFAVNERIVWAISNSITDSGNVFTRTIDSGDTWAPGTVNEAMGMAPTSIYALNADTAWMSMYDKKNWGGGIFRTNDAGQHWTKQATAKFAAPNGFPNAVCFFDALNGVALGDPNNGYFEIYTTSDGGENWLRVPGNNMPPSNFTAAQSTAFFKLDNSLWFVAIDGRVFNSQDKGIHWTASQTIFFGIQEYPSQVGQIVFKNQNDGLINFKKFNTRHSPFYFKGTGDGGKTWEKRTFAPFAISDSVVFSKIAFVPGSQSTWVGNYRVYKNKRSSPGFAFSKDDGKTWIPVPLEAANMNVIKTELLFINDHTGWVAGNSVNPTKYGIYKWTGVLPE